MPDTRIQKGIRCSNCQDVIYSNSRHDFVTCHCEWWFIDGGFDYIRYGGTGMDVVGHPEYVYREVTVKGLPWRYRDEVPDRREAEA